MLLQLLLIRNLYEVACWGRKYYVKNYSKQQKSDNVTLQKWNLRKATRYLTTMFYWLKNLWGSVSFTPTICSRYSFLRVAQPWAIQYLTKITNLTFWQLANVIYDKYDTKHTQSATHTMWPTQLERRPRWEGDPDAKATMVLDKKFESIQRPLTNIEATQ